MKNTPINRTQSMATSFTQSYVLRLFSIGIRQRHCVFWTSNISW